MNRLVSLSKAFFWIDAFIIATFLWISAFFVLPAGAHWTANFVNYFAIVVAAIMSIAVVLFLIAKKGGEALNNRIDKLFERLVLKMERLAPLSKTIFWVGIFVLTTLLFGYFLQPESHWINKLTIGSAFLLALVGMVQHLLSKKTT